MGRFNLTLDECKKIDGYHIDNNNVGEQALANFCKVRSINAKSIDIPITCQHNMNVPIHRWTSYIHGFSASFVNDVFSKYNGKKWKQIMDPFCGSGTVAVSSILTGKNCWSIDINPYLTLVTEVKTKKDREWKRIFSLSIPWKKLQPAPKPFLTNTNKHFSKINLIDLLKIKSFIQKQPETLSDILRVILSSILIPASYLQRQPNLGYRRNINTSRPSVKLLFKEKLEQIQSDVPILIKATGNSKVYTGSATEKLLENDSIDLVITSPPYSNGVDYFFNYKLELAWLDICESYEDGINLKKNLIGGDNTPIRYLSSFSNDIPIDSPGYNEIEKIKNNILLRRERFGKKGYQRNNIPAILQKYFSDMKSMLITTHNVLRPNGRLILVQGDSLFSDVYLPSDLIIAEIAEDIGFKIKSVEITRKRRSGQRRQFPLHESIITFTKN